MSQSICLNLSPCRVEASPFSHLSCTSVLQEEVAKELYQWFEKTNLWNLTEEDFYTQYEFVLTEADLPTSLESLINSETIETIQTTLKHSLKIKSLKTVSIVAHKLVDGHKIGVHNDYINGEETHRLIIQINPNWNASKGGFLILFNSANAEDVSKVIQPLNNSAFGFEISEKSYHAVSTVHASSRYSIVYTFKKE